MAVSDSAILRSVERKIDHQGIDPSRVDVLVMQGHVTITGALVDRLTHRPMDGVSREKFKRELFRVDGVTEVTLHTHDAHAGV